MNDIDFEKIKFLNQEIKELLLAHPELIPLQKEVDIRLAKCNNQHNRLVIISQMMWDSFLELNEKLQNFRNKSIIKLSLVDNVIEE